MQVNEILAGIVSGIFMLPVSIIISFILRHMLQQMLLAILLSVVSATVVLLFAPLPAIYAWKYHVIEIVIMSHGVTYLLFSHWATGVVSMFLGIAYVFKNLPQKNNFSPPNTKQRTVMKHGNGFIHTIE